MPAAPTVVNFSNRTAGNKPFDYFKISAWCVSVAAAAAAHSSSVAAAGAPTDFLNANILDAFIKRRPARPSGRTLTCSGRIMEDYTALICLYLANLGAEPRGQFVRIATVAWFLPSAAGLLVLAEARSEDVSAVNVSESWGGGRERGRKKSFLYFYVQVSERNGFFESLAGGIWRRLMRKPPHLPPSLS